MSEAPLALAEGEIEIINDGDGVVIIGDDKTVSRFLAAKGIVSRTLSSRQVGAVLGRAGDVMEAGAKITEHSGRWVQLTDKSAMALKQGKLMSGSTPGVGRAIITKRGKTDHILEIVQSPGTFFSNPAVLTGLAGLMTQLAMQNAMDEITSHLKNIDRKCDQILQAQNDAIFAGMEGAARGIDEAMMTREETGRVNEVTWSKIQGTFTVLNTVRAEALRRLVEQVTQIEDEAKADMDSVAAGVRDWLVVIGRCEQLLDALAILELDRVLETEPTQVDAQRRSIQRARASRLGDASRQTNDLIEQLKEIADRANGRILFHPWASPETLRVTQGVVQHVEDFQKWLGLHSEATVLEQRRWSEAAEEARDKVWAVTTERAGDAKRIGGAVMRRSRETSSKLKASALERVRQNRADSDET